MKILALVVMLIATSQVHKVVADDMKAAIEEVIAQTPGRAAIWTDDYLPYYGYSELPAFSPILMKTEAGEAYRIAQSRLFLFDPARGTVSYYFIVLENEAESYEVLPASTSKVSYLMNEYNGLSVDQVRERLNIAEELATRYEHKMSEVRNSPWILSLLAEPLFGYLFVATVTGQGKMSEQERLLSGIFWGASLSLSTGWLISGSIQAIRNKREVEGIIRQLKSLW